MDTSLVIEATSKPNAKAKAENQGVIVTAVTTVHGRSGRRLALTIAAPAVLIIAAASLYLIFFTSHRPQQIDELRFGPDTGPHIETDDWIKSTWTRPTTAWIHGGDRRGHHLVATLTYGQDQGFYYIKEGIVGEPMVVVKLTIYDGWHADEDHIPGIEFSIGDQSMRWSGSLRSLLSKTIDTESTQYIVKIPAASMAHTLVDLDGTASVIIDGEAFSLTPRSTRVLSAALRMM